MLRDPGSRKLYGAGSGGGGGGKKKPKKKPPKFKPVYGNTMARVYGNAPAVRMPTPPPRPAPRAPVDPITAQLEALYGPEQSYLQNLIRSQTEQANAAQLRRQALNQSYAQWYSQHVPGQIQGIYSQAGQDQSAFAKGFSDGMQHIQQQGASQANDIMGLAGAPQGQMIQPNADAADVLYGTGGYIPASTFSREGAAFASAASLMPGAIVAQGQAQAAKDREGSDANIAKLEGELAKLMSKKAEAGLKIREARRAEKLKIAIENAKLKAAAKKDDEMMAYRWASLDLQQKKAILSDKRQAQRIFQAQKRIGLTAQNQSFNQWYKQQTLAQGAARIQQGDVRLQQAQTRLDNAGSSKGLSPSSLRVLRKQAGEIAKDAAVGVPTTQHDANGNPVYGNVHMSYQEALKEGLAKGIPLDVMQKALNYYWAPGRKGIKRGKKGGLYFPEFEKPGEGRPAKPYQARNPKAGAAKGGGQNTAFVEGRPVLPATFTATHQTDGLPGYPATDYMLPAGTTVGAPISGTIERVHHTQPGNPKVYGWIMYLHADNGDIYFLTHFDNVFVRDGQRVQRGSALGTVAPYGSASHIHIGVHRNRRV